MMTLARITNIDNKKHIALLDTSSISFMQGLEAKGIPSDDILKNEILKRGILPYYGTSMSHIASQRVALGAGFVPAWAELVTSKIGDAI